MFLGIYFYCSGILGVISLTAIAAGMNNSKNNDNKLFFPKLMMYLSNGTLRKVKTENKNTTIIFSNTNPFIPN